MRIRDVLPALLLVGCARASSTPAPVAAAPPLLAPGTALTAAQRKWIDSTFASLSLRQQVGQMVMMWVLGDYTSTEDPTFAEVRRWIVEDGIGGVSMSLGSP